MNSISKVSSILLLFLFWSINSLAEISTEDAKAMLLDYDRNQLLVFQNGMLELCKSNTEKASSSKFIEDKRVYLKLADIVADNGVLIEAFLDLDFLANSANKVNADKILHSWFKKIQSSVAQMRVYCKEYDVVAMTKSVREDVQKHDKLFQRLEEFLNKMQLADSRSETSQL